MSRLHPPIPARRSSYLLALSLAASAATSLQAKNIVVTTVDNAPLVLGAVSFKKALSQLADGDVIQFNIPGPGPHVITTPLGGYPLITANNVTIDGYSQPGSKPNSNGILGGNNAVIDIVLDSSGSDQAPSLDPAKPDQVQRRSTRLLFSGYGDSENGILGVVGGDGFKVRGLSFLGRPTDGSTADPAIYAVALVQEAKNAKVQGCWFGLKPGDPYTMESIKPVTDAVAAFRFRDGGDVYSGGLTFGTDGDGTADVQEFNVVVGTHIGLAIEAPDLRVSGNYINVFPDGLTFVDVEAMNQIYLAAGRSGGDASIEFMENGRVTDNTIIGTNGDGKSDGNERNIIAHTAYSHDIEFYSNATNTVVAGNYFGVGVDGTTAQPALAAFTPDLISLPGGNASIRVGSNGDGVSDDIEGNLIYNIPGARFVQSGVTTPITARRNKFVNAAFAGFPFADGGDSRAYTDYYANAIDNPASGVVPIITAITDGILTGTLPAPKAGTFTKSVVDIYVIDKKAAAAGLNLPGTYAGSFADGGTGDQDAAANKFKVDLRGLPIAPGDSIALAVTYTSAAAGTPGTNSITGPLSAASVANLPVLIPGSVESIGLTRIVPDKAIIVPQNDALGNWEPYASVLGTSAFLIEGNTFADGFDATDGKQRYVVAIQPVDGKPGKTVEGFYDDAKSPFNGPINASRQNGNPGRVAGDTRPGATHYIVGGEASPHTVSQFGSDNRWNLGFDRLADGRYGTVQTFDLNLTSLTPAPLMKAQDSSNGRLKSGTAAGSQISRFGGDVVGLGNGNFLSVVEDRSHVIAPVDAVLATIFAPDGSIVKDTFVVANSDLWSNVAAYQGGFAVRCKPQDGSATRVIYLFDNDGNAKGVIAQTSSGASFDGGRGDGTRLAGHINSPYIYLAGKVTDAQIVKVAVWDTRDPQRTATFDASEPAFVGNNDRANLAVDALNRVVVSWVSSPDGYEANQVAARVLAFNGDAMKFTALTPSFFPFVNAAKTQGIHTFQMSVATTTKQICIAAKGEINLQNKPALGATLNPSTGAPLKELNFYTVFSHPFPQDDPTPAVGAAGSITVTAAKSGSNLVLTWTGGTGPFVVQKKAAITDAWIDASTTSDRTYSTPASAATGFYRVTAP